MDTVTTSAQTSRQGDHSLLQADKRRELNFYAYCKMENDKMLFAYMRKKQKKIDMKSALIKTLGSWWCTQKFHRMKRGLKRQLRIMLAAISVAVSASQATGEEWRYEFVFEDLDPQYFPAHYLRAYKGENRRIIHTSSKTIERLNVEAKGWRFYEDHMVAHMGGDKVVVVREPEDGSLPHEMMVTRDGEDRTVRYRYDKIEKINSEEGALDFTLEMTQRGDLDPSIQGEQKWKVYYHLSEVQQTQGEQTCPAKAGQEEEMVLDGWKLHIEKGEDGYDLSAEKGGQIIECLLVSDTPIEHIATCGPYWIGRIGNWWEPPGKRIVVLASIPNAVYPQVIFVSCDPWRDPESTRDDTVERVSYDKGELSIQFRVSIREKETLLTKRYLCKIRIDSGAPGDGSFPNSSSGILSKAVNLVKKWF